MTVGDLLINIGIKGSEKVGESLSGVSKWLKGVGSTSLETKAAIIGVVYGLEHFMSKSAELGMSLQQFGTLTGLSTDTLQKISVAGLRAGVSFDEVTSSVKGAQKAIAEMQLGQGPVGGYAMISRYAGGFDISKLNDTYYVLEKLRKFAQNKDVPLPFANYFLGQSHVSDNMISFLRDPKKSQWENVPNSMIQSNAQIAQNAQISASWAMLGKTVEMAWGKLTAKHGGQIVSELTGITHKVLKLVDAFLILSEKLQLFKALGKVFEGWGLIFTGINNAVNALNSVGGKEGKLNDKKIGENVDNVAQKFFELILGNPDRSRSIGDVGKTMENRVDKLHNLISHDIGKVIKVADQRANSVHNFVVNVAHHGDAKDTQAVKDLHAQAHRQQTKQYNRVAKLSPAFMGSK